jgi:dUTP pyrophosphatase
MKVNKACYKGSKTWYKILENRKEQIEVFVYNESDNADPSYQTDGAAGMDIAANEEVVIPVGKIQAVSTGLKFGIPAGYEGQVRPRSSMGLRGITIPNTPGTIDCDYRGEVKVLLHNLSTSEFIVKKGDRIAQLIIKESLRPNLTSVSYDEWTTNISKTHRGEGGFGSTGEN